MYLMENLIPILLFTLSTTLTPGPNNFMVMNSGLNFGVKRSVPHYLGICFGFPMMVLIVALGFGALFVKYMWIKNLLKVFGSAYMIYLAYCILRMNANVKTSQVKQPFTFIQ